MKTAILFFVVFLVSCKINQKKNGVEVGRWKYVAGTTTEKSIIKGKYDK